jgi:hypothetical protein
MSTNWTQFLPTDQPDVDIVIIRHIEKTGVQAVLVLLLFLFLFCCCCFVFFFLENGGWSWG